MKKQSNNQSTDYRNTGLPEYRNTGKSAIRNPQSAINKTGFTLMELMMSLGILVVGLSMIATAFPTAMLETKYSVADTSATMISENAAAICRVKLSHSDIGDADVDGTLSDANDEDDTRINPRHTGDLTYPTATPTSRYGWLMAIREAGGADDNDYQLVIVPYRKFLPTDAPPTFTTNVTVDGTKKKITGDISIGSPVISVTDGTFAYVLDSAGNLSGEVTVGAALAVGADGQDSPAIGCYVVRTAVAP